MANVPTPPPIHVNNTPAAAATVILRANRALRRTPNLGLKVSGQYSPQFVAALNQFKQAAGLPTNGAVDAATWAALPDGRPMPTLQQGSTGAVVKSLQRVLTNGAVGGGFTAPNAIDGIFGPSTMASVKSFQTWGGVTSDGIVGDQTWSVSLHAMSSTLETAVGLNFVV
jgi:peptidoglycan hydrolase-like protein with peptidoglycan-binding domain